MQPRSREERHMFKHKETLERERLKNRTGNYFRYEEIKDPLAQEETGPAYIREKDRLTAGGVVKIGNEQWCFNPIGEDATTTDYHRRYSHQVAASFYDQQQSQSSNTGRNSTSSGKRVSQTSSSHRPRSSVEGSELALGTSTKILDPAEQDSQIIQSRSSQINLMDQNQTQQIQVGPRRSHGIASATVNLDHFTGRERDNLSYNNNARRQHLSIRSGDDPSAQSKMMPIITCQPSHNVVRRNFSKENNTNSTNDNNQKQVFKPDPYLEQLADKNLLSIDRGAVERGSLERAFGKTKKEIIYSERGNPNLTDKFAEERQLAEDRRNQNTEVHRREHVQREEDRWNAEDAKERSSQDRAKRMIEDPLIGKKNVSAVPYNIVSLNYHDSYEGRKLKHNDDMTRYRGELRKVNLAHKAHLGYNCILGEQAYKINAPQKPDAFNEEPPKGYQVEFGQVQ